MQITNKKNSKFRLLTTVFVLLLVAGVGIFYAYQYTKQQAETNDRRTSTQKLGGGSITSSKENSKTDEDSPSPSEDSTPLKPSGTFVSNHRPNLSGSPAPNTITSTCTTTPGASCTIRFSNGDIVKSLPSKTTDSNGNVGWVWKLQDVGLSVGNWKIVAVASIGKNVVEEPDSLDLIVGE